MRNESYKPPLEIGLTVSPYGKIAAIMLTGGERYYFLIDEVGTVSMMPASVIEPCVRPEGM